MACADVATAKAKTTAINLIILSSYVNLQEERFLKHADLVRRLAFGERLGSQGKLLQHSFYGPRPTKRKWVDVPTFSTAKPVLMVLGHALMARHQPRACLRCAPSAIIDALPSRSCACTRCQEHLRQRQLARSSVLTSVAERRRSRVPETWPYDRFGLSSLVEGSVRRVGVIDKGSARAPPKMVESQARCQACAASIQRLNGVNGIPRKRINSEAGWVNCEGVGAWSREPAPPERQFWALSCCCHRSIACSIICDCMLEAFRKCSLAALVACSGQPNARWAFAT